VEEKACDLQALEVPGGRRKEPSSIWRAARKRSWWQTRRERPDTKWWWCQQSWCDSWEWATGGIKNDVRDAQQLSNVSCRLADYRRCTFQAPWSRERKAMCNNAGGPDRGANQTGKPARSWLRTQDRCVAWRRAETFPGRFRRHVASRGRTVPEEVNRVCSARSLEPRILEPTSSWQRAAGKRSDCKLLMTAPGIGPVSSLRYAAALDDISRFSQLRTGWRPTGRGAGRELDRESRKRRMTGITKAGPPRVRWALTQAAWAVSQMQEARTRWPSGHGRSTSGEAKEMRGRRVGAETLGGAVRHVARRQALRSRTTRARRQGWPPAWWRTPSCLTTAPRPAPSWGGRSSAGSANATTPACTDPGRRLRSG